MAKIADILHVCQESRLVGMPHYSLGFDVSRGNELLEMDPAAAAISCAPEASVPGRPNFYWNPTKDIVYLQPAAHIPGDVSQLWGGGTGVIFGKMKTLAIHFSIAFTIPQGKNFLWEGGGDVDI